MGIDFTIVPGKGPKILKPIASQSDISSLKRIVGVENQVPFLGPILKATEFSMLHCSFVTLVRTSCVSELPVFQRFCM